MSDIPVQPFILEFAALQKCNEEMNTVICDFSTVFPIKKIAACSLAMYIYVQMQSCRGAIVSGTKESHLI